jgi:hypothetical protein
MRSAIRILTLAGVLSLGVLVLGSSEARADEYGHGGHHHDGGYGGVPAYGYYGNGGHDFQPHWHTKRTPFGTFQWYGNGRHDLRPHGHTVTPYGIESYNGRRTRSYSPPTPYIYQPW